MRGIRAAPASWIVFATLAIFLASSPMPFQVGDGLDHHHDHAQIDCRGWRRAMILGAGLRPVRLRGD